MHASDAFGTAPTASAGPGRGWYVAAVVLATACVGAAIGLGFSAFVSRLHALETIAGPAVVRLGDGDRRGIYEDRILSSAGDPTASVGPGSGCSVRAPSGASVAIGSVGGSFTLSDTNHEWHATGSFTAREKGPYRVSCPRSDEGLAVGPDPSVLALVRDIFGVIALGLGGPLAGAAIAVAVYLRRRSTRRASALSRGA